MTNGVFKPETHQQVIGETVGAGCVFIFITVTCRALDDICFYPYACS